MERSYWNSQFKLFQVCEKKLLEEVLAFVSQFRMLLFTFLSLAFNINLQTSEEIFECRNWLCFWNRNF